MVSAARKHGMLAVICGQLITSLLEGIDLPYVGHKECISKVRYEVIKDNYT